MSPVGEPAAVGVVGVDTGDDLAYLGSGTFGRRLSEARKGVGLE